jgi:hypothetical protein
VAGCTGRLAEDEIQRLQRRLDVLESRIHPEAGGHAPAGMREPGGT